MYELRKQHGDKIDIAYQHERSSQQFLFSGGGEVWYNNTQHGSFSEFLSKPTPIFMVDGTGVKLEELPATFVFCSPHRDWRKYMNAIYVHARVLPVWPWQHLVAARQLNFQDVSEQPLAELYTKWGGIPRVVLEKADSKSYQIITMDKALAKARSLSDILATVGHVSAPDDDSGRILHYAVEPDFIEFQVFFASQWVADEVVRSAGQQAERQIREFVAAQENNPQAAGLRGQVLKALEHKVL
ncbi:g11380 [Coccomyxa elongata]